MNLGYSNTLWEAFWDRFLLLVRMSRSLIETRDRFRDRRTQVVNIDPLGNITTITLAGIRYRTNTSQDGKLYARFVANGGDWDVTLYKATGGGAGNAVAHVTALADGGTAALVADNSSGISGSITIDGTVTGDITDGHQLHVYQDWRADVDATFDRTDAQGEDLKTIEAMTSAINDIEGLMDQAVSRMVQLFSEFMVGDPANRNDRGYGSKFLKEAFSNLLSETIETDPTSGAVGRLRKGAFEALRLAMVDEATGSTQSVERRLTAAAAGVAVTGNDGQGAIASHTPEAHCPTGTYTFTCVRGLGNGGGGQEEFEVTFASNVDDRTKTHSGRARVAQAFKGEDGFGGSSGITITRTFTKTGDGSNLHLATVASGWTVSGEREVNTSSGVLYWKIVEETPTTWAVEFYRAASMQAGDLVARSTAVAASTAFQAVERRGSGLTINGTNGSAPVNGTTGTIDLNFFTTQNTTGRPDAFTVAVSLTSTGIISKVMSELPFLSNNGYRLNGVAASSELISDGRAMANTFEAFVVEDN